MPKPFAADIRMNAGRKHLRRMSVAKIVETNPGQGGRAYRPYPLMRQGSRLQRLPFRLSDHRSSFMIGKATTAAHAFAAVGPDHLIGCYLPCGQLRPPGAGNGSAISKSPCQRRRTLPLAASTLKAFAPIRLHKPNQQDADLQGSS